MNTDPIKNTRDPQDLLHSVLSELANTGIKHLLTWLRQPEHSRLPAAIIEHPPSSPARDHLEAAALLGVDLDASPDEIRAAFRASIRTQMVDGDFHDQRGAATDRRAQRLVDAKNLLIERRRGGQS